MKKLLLIGTLSIFGATIAYSAANITHPNLKDAYDEAGQAIQHIHEAQQYQGNKKVEFGGHGDKAIAAFQQAQAELVQADQYNDAHTKK